MVQEWFVAGARFGFIGFFTTLIFLALWLFVLCVISLAASFRKDDDDDEP